MSSIEYASHPTEPRQYRTLAQTVRSFWCRHPRVVTTEKAPGMPAHTVCVACGWREPVAPAVPQGVRTWDSTRDEARYQLEKKRRAMIEHQRQLAEARMATPPRTRRSTREQTGNVVRLQPASGE